jgi:ribosomal protein L7Ae-like RNA K-turn-binding protein
MCWLHPHITVSMVTMQAATSEDMKHLLEKVRSKRKGVSGVKKVLKKIETFTKIS